MVCTDIQEASLDSIKTKMLGRPRVMWTDQMRVDMQKSTEKSGHRYKNSVCGRTEKTGEEFVIKQSNITPTLYEVQTDLNIT
jgi:hypothetical protein